jgi:hypothetical protein
VSPKFTSSKRSASPLLIHPAFWPPPSSSVSCISVPVTSSAFSTCNGW